MTDNYSFRIHIDSKDLAAPVKSIVDKVSRAMGFLYEPIHIERKARAEANAALIAAQGDIAVNETLRRALSRLASEEVLKQQTIEDITEKASHYVSDAATPDNVDDDWIRNLFDKARIVTNEEMKDLWARLLARESDSPSSVSRATVNIVSQMSARDAWGTKQTALQRNAGIGKSDGNGDNQARTVERSSEAIA